MTHYKNWRAEKPHAKAIAKQDDGKIKKLMIWMMAALFMLGALTLMTSISSAQQNKFEEPSPTQGAVPGASQGITSDSELWRTLKSGGTGKVSDRNPAARTAIQTNGMDWLRIRNGAFPTYSAWGILGIIALLGLFFGLRGRIRIGHGGPSGETILRFKWIERMGHWLLASSFIILALTGLNLIYGRELLIPLIGKEAFATISVYGKLAHNYVAFAFMVSLVWVAITWIRHNIPHPRDIMWFLKGGGILGGAHPAAKKFNAGQKIIFWMVILGGISLSLSGWALLFPFTTNYFAGTFGTINSIFGTELPAVLTGIQEQQLAQLWHGIMSVVMVIIVIAHIYIGSVGMEGAFAAMSSGEVDRTWAMEHHSLWVEEEDAKAESPSRTETIQPAE